MGVLMRTFLMLMVFAPLSLFADNRFDSDDIEDLPKHKLDIVIEKLDHLINKLDKVTTILNDWWQIDVTNDN
jgi:hypothetical protein